MGTKNMFPEAETAIKSLIPDGQLDRYELTAVRAVLRVPTSRLKLVIEFVKAIRVNDSYAETRLLESRELIAKWGSSFSQPENLTRLSLTFEFIKRIKVSDPQTAKIRVAEARKLIADWKSPSSRLLSRN